jgi:chaperonin GroEL
MLLSTETIIAEIKEETPAMPMGGAPGMGGMGGMM